MIRQPVVTGVVDKQEKKAATMSDFTATTPSPEATGDAPSQDPARNAPSHDPAALPGVITSLGGGHGLFQTLRAARLIAQRTVNAVVTVADDGGSSGRIRRELGMLPPGDLRMALCALAADDAAGHQWEEVLQYRFGGTGALAGHAVGNLLLAGLHEVLGSPVEALDAVARLAGCCGRVVPMVEEGLEIEADVAGLDEDPRIVHPVRGQVAVATTPGSVRRVRLYPPAPVASPTATAAIMDADMVTLGPGSWFTSVIPHVLVPGIMQALERTDAIKVLVLNVKSEPGETAGFSMERHIHVLAQHAPTLRVDTILVDSHTPMTGAERRYLEHSAKQLGATVVRRALRGQGARGEQLDVHDPERLSSALADAYVTACETRRNG